MYACLSTEHDEIVLSGELSRLPTVLVFWCYLCLDSQLFFFLHIACPFQDVDCQIRMSAIETHYDELKALAGMKREQLVERLDEYLEEAAEDMAANTIREALAQVRGLRLDEMDEEDEDEEDDDDVEEEEMDDEEEGEEEAEEIPEGLPLVNNVDAMRHVLEEQTSDSHINADVLLAPQEVVGGAANTDSTPIIQIDTVGDEPVTMDITADQETQNVSAGIEDVEIDFGCDVSMDTEDVAAAAAATKPAAADVSIGSEINSGMACMVQN